MDRNGLNGSWWIRPQATDAREQRAAYFRLELQLAEKAGNSSGQPERCRPLPPLCKRQVCLRRTGERGPLLTIITKRSTWPLI